MNKIPWKHKNYAQKKNDSSKVFKKTKIKCMYLKETIPVMAAM